MISAKELRRLIDYDPETGIFKWKIARSNVIKVGGVVGWPVGAQNHLAVRLNGRGYLLHRLAWLHVYGRWPKGNLDHINRNPQDNRIYNLREGTQQQNTFNAGPSKNNTTGRKGVSWNKQKRKYGARIQVNGKTAWSGLFNTIEEAGDAHDEVAKKLHGEFFYK